MPVDFLTTRWTLVLQAAQKGQTEQCDAFSQLLSDYWYPLYAFLRRSGKRSEEAEDLIQEFYAYLIEKDILSEVQGGRRGRFRNFLLVCLKNFVINHWQRETAQKRGGHRKHFSINADRGEDRYELQPFDNLTPERAFDRSWALEVMERSMQRVAQKWDEAGKAEKFHGLKVFLLPEEQTPSYQDVANQLGMSLDSVKVAIHRLKAEFRKSLCAEVSETLLRGDLLEDELNHLFSALSQ